MTESSADHSLTAGPEDAEERHRPLVRELNRSLSAAYGYGGGAVLLVVGVVVAVGWALGGLLSLSTWFFAITIGLIGLFVLSAVLRRRRARMRSRFEDYCRLNGLSEPALREYFLRDGTYPYFAALFDDAGRHRPASLEGSAPGDAPTTPREDQER